MAVESLVHFRRKILDMAARHGARNIRVFGSVARGDNRPDSDLDLLVDVEPGRTLLDVIALEQDLQELLGRRVDVLTEVGLSPYLQERILAEAASL
jgi:predicted nucleotidyltransferase